MTIEERVAKLESECTVRYELWLKAGWNLRSKQIERDAARAERERIEAKERRQLAKVLGAWTQEMAT